MSSCPPSKTFVARLIKQPTFDLYVCRDNDGETCGPGVGLGIWINNIYQPGIKEIDLLDTIFLERKEKKKRKRKKRHPLPKIYKTVYETERHSSTYMHSATKWPACNGAWIISYKLRFSYRVSFRYSLDDWQSKCRSITITTMTTTIIICIVIITQMSQLISRDC